MDDAVTIMSVVTNGIDSSAINAAEYMITGTNMGNVVAVMTAATAITTNIDITAMSSIMITGKVVTIIIYSANIIILYE